jgi:two-component system phosphate regulon response regulator PhoB
MKSCILVIDDEPDFNFLVKHNLEAEGEFRVLTATDGPAGIQAAFRCQPDLVLLDVLMSRMNGIEVLKKLKKDPKTRQIPVIMLSAVGDAETKAKVLYLYVEDYIEKPADVGLLASRIREVLSRRQPVRY